MKQDPIDYADKYFNLKFELEKSLRRQIDLLEQRALKKPCLKQQVDKTKILIYGGKVKTWLFDIKRAIEEINSFLSKKEGLLRVQEGSRN